MSIFKKYILLIALLLTASNADAQKVDSVKTVTLGEVKIVGSIIENMQALPFNTTVINTKLFYQTNQSGLEVLRQNSGINIRTNGAYGANAEFFINGISGKQIKFFVDGNPVDNLGETQGINIVPIQQTERFEIYKGVIPIELGTDALGGAVNIVTRKENKDFVDFSTAYSSFNTFKNSLQLRKGFGQHFYAMLSGSYNHADNNYLVTAEVPNQLGKVELKGVPRFHNEFDFSNLKLEAGFLNTKWADKFSIQAQYATTQSELQHNLLMRQPYGEAAYTDLLRGITVQYQKANLLKNVTFNAFLSYNETKNVFIDTTLNVYNWEGIVVDKRFSGGEISNSGNLLTTHAKVLNTRQIVSYYPTSNVKLSLANTTQSFNRTGEDPFSLAFLGVDFFGQAQKMFKNVAGVSLETRWLGGKLVNLSSAKYFHADFIGNKRENVRFVAISQNIDRLGYNTAFTYFIKSNFFLKTSYENATRLPDETETFGDLMLVRPNPALLPEQSENLNLNLVYRSPNVDAEVSGFFRRVDNIIYLPPAAFYAQYQNTLKTDIAGVEAAVKVRPTTWLSMNANFTYQDLRNKSFIEGFGNNERYINARMPNIPYLFANGGVAISKDSVLGKKAQIQFYWNTSYVHDYYLYWAIDGDPDLKNSIPAQFVNHFGLSIFHYKSKISVAFDVNNIFNKSVFDNFNVQLPGRIYSIKFRFFHLNKN